MASVSWDTFERYRQKGLDARRAGQWDSARIYLLEAARSIVELSKDAQSEELKEARRQTGAKLLELAKDCETAKSEQRSAPINRQSAIGNRQSQGESDGGASASDWIIKEKPSLRFDDVAGLDG